jgi:two-component system, cell cycle response regulator DivK
MASAAKRALNISPDLLLVDLDVPLLYGMVEARQNIKNAQLGILLVVIVTREPALDSSAMMEVGVRGNEYVTRLSDYQQLETTARLLVASRFASYLIFCFSNPAAVRCEEVSAMSTEVRRAEARGSANLKSSRRRRSAEKPKVLIVEDHDDTREMLRILLEMKGCQVTEASDGLEAVEVARRQRPSLILMDGSLPLLDGLSATRLIREDPRLRGTFIISLNGWGTPRYHAAALAAGCDDCLEKPIDFEKLESYLGGLFKSQLPLPQLYSPAESTVTSTAAACNIR